MMTRIIVIVLVFLSIPVFLFSQDAEENTKTIEGFVSGVDWVGATITVKWLKDAGNIEYKEVLVSVPPEIKIYKDSDTVELAEINIGDQVRVEYDNSSGTPTAKSIIVTIK